jgi:2-polyprenyl-3-methyl-5-hydroxy-6-metoxy-1,4-benzoquinol methylase
LSKPKPQKDDQQKLVDEFFDTNVAFWKDIQRKGHRWNNYQRRQAIALSYIDGLQLQRTTRVLKIGCGAGLLSTALARRGFYVEGIDHAHAMIELTQKRTRIKGLENQINARKGDIHELSYRDQSFNLIVALGVILGSTIFERIWPRFQESWHQKGALF